MIDREFRSQGIDELEILFQEQQTNQSVLVMLQLELQHRKTNRAKTLLGKVNAIINSSHVTAAPEGRQEVKLEERDAENDFSDVDWVTLFNEEREQQVGVVGEVANPKVMTDKPEDILDTWTIFEALSPQSFNKPKDLVLGTGSVAYFNAPQLPWELGEKSQPNKKLFYLVYLGSVDLKRTSEGLLQLYKDDRQEIPNVTGQAALAVVMLDKNGVPCGENPISISSYGWSYGHAVNGDLDNLKHWGAAEKKLQEEVEKILVREDEEGNTVPLSLGQIMSAHDWLVRNCLLTKSVVTVPSFAIRQYLHMSKSEPVKPLLNSFYLQDIQRAKVLVTQGVPGSALYSYLGLSPTQDKRHDMLTDLDIIERVLEPKNMPLGRWPVKGRFPLVLLQQSAVNLACAELKDGGIFSVNGPPGTGKTTLLRDVVASVVIDRATVMSRYDKPESAFQKSGTMNARGKVDLFKVDDALKGFEILVTSFNNKAVENITKELPLRKAIDDEIELGYFEPLAKSLFPEAGDAWGLVATVLGNATNKSAFVNNAWWDYDTSLYSYFSYMNGTLDVKLDLAGEPTFPAIVRECDPPENDIEALERWKSAQQEFQRALDDAQRINTIAQKGLEAERSVFKTGEELELVAEERRTLESKIEGCNVKFKKSQNTLDVETQKLTLQVRKRELHNGLKMGWFARLFARSKHRVWKGESSKLNNAEVEQLEITITLREELQTFSQRVESLNNELVKVVAQENNLLARKRTEQESIEQSAKVCGGRLVTPVFLDKKHTELQVSTPVFTDDSHRVRDDLFIAAIRLHKAFIDAAARPIRQNLAAFMAVLGNRSLPRDSAALLADIWTTGFLVCPAFSSAFASIDRMLSGLPRESIGWLLIDEAGQVSPQQAVGAIMRSKRVMVVGDPMQIEPVVTTPKPLLEGISSYMSVDHFKWVAPEASVQTLADSVNRFGTTIDRELRSLWIGSPLLVHRRCEEPMFSISNQMAYNGKMVKATMDKPSAVSDVLGCKANWFSVQGHGEDKWCTEEGEYVVDKVFEIVSAGDGEPELFIISPFRVVAQRMSSRLRQESHRLIESGIVNPDAWIKNSVGTVHTFQGKEADTVILVLGAPNVSQIGARNWAGKSVNLLNVAVSRAKHNFYIVGNKELWSGIGQMPLITREIGKFIEMN